MKKKFFWNFFFILAVFLLDRVSKISIINLLENSDNGHIQVTNFLSFNLIWNEGIAFGLLNFNNDLIYNTISVLIILISLTILYLAFKNKNYSGYFFAMILGGSLGNLFDRIKFSAVPDFIDLHIGNYHWFIFNVADIFISLGIICLIFVELFYNKKV